MHIHINHNYTGHTCNIKASAYYTGQQLVSTGVGECVRVSVRAHNKQY